MRWSATICLGAALSASICGCRSNSCAVVESELRAREEDVRVLREDLSRSHFYNQSLLRELSAHRGTPGPMGVLERPSEPYPVCSLSLGRQTAGKPCETLGADDGLMVQLEPKDPEGQAIKAPGRAFIAALEVPAEGPKRLFSTWEIGPEELRCKWQNGLFNTGYVLTLPWRAWPTTEKVRVVARFQMINGRTFEADKDITVRVLAESKRALLGTPPPLPLEPPLAAPSGNGPLLLKEPPKDVPLLSPDAPLKAEPTKDPVPLPPIHTQPLPLPSPPPFLRDQPMPVPPAPPVTNESKQPEPMMPVLPAPTEEKPGVLLPPPTPEPPARLLPPPGVDPSPKDVAPPPMKKEEERPGIPLPPPTPSDEVHLRHQGGPTARLLRPVGGRSAK